MPILCIHKALLDLVIYVDISIQTVPYCVAIQLHVITAYSNSSPNTSGTLPSTLLNM